MIKIGLVGEDPNDTSAIKNLLLKAFEGRVQFFKSLRIYVALALTQSIMAINCG